MSPFSSTRKLESRAVARSYFGTDGVRGIVGEFVTPELLEQLGKASALWSGRGRVFIGRDTRASGQELEEAFARGVASAGGSAVLAGVVPTPAVALLRLDLGVIVTASHNPPEYNGVKFFDRDGRKLSDAAEEEIEALLDAPAPGGGEIAHVDVAIDSYLEHVLESFSCDLSGLRIAVDCANGSYAHVAPRAFAELGAHVEAIGDSPDGSNINVGCGATDLAALQQTVTSGKFDLGVAFDGDGDRMLAVDENGAALDGDQIVAILALALGVDLVAVTTMTNLGFHRLDGGARHPRDHDGRRRPLRARGAVPRGRDPRRRAVRAHHFPARPRHRRRPRVGAAALRCALRTEAVRGCRADGAISAGQAEFAARRARPASCQLREQDRRCECRARRRRPRARAASGTEPVVRVLAEAPTEEEAERLCARIASLVTQELG